MSTYADSPPSVNSGAQAAGIVVSLFVLAGIGVFSCYCAKRARKAIVSDLRAAVAPPPPPPFVGHVWATGTPTVERFIQDMVAMVKPERYTAQQICAFTSNYSTRLGSGGFGVVYKGEFPSGEKIAVKVLNRSLDRKAEEQFMAEVCTIGRTYHINLVRLYGFCYDNLMSALVYEYMENGSLDNYLFNGKEKVEWEKLREIAIGTARGIAYLHEECEQRIIHYDIKPGNILLDAKFSPKVADFGLAKLCNRESTHVSITGYRGTPGYSAPEFLLRNFHITHKCDVYSYGMLLFEIIGRRRNTGANAGHGSAESLNFFPKHIWDNYEKGELATLMTSCGIEEKDRNEAERMSKIALWCVQDSPDARPPMSSVVKMLETGGAGESLEIMPPPKPFSYLYSVGMNVPIASYHTGTDMDSSGYSTSKGTNLSTWYKESTPIMTRYEIQFASS